MTDHTVDTVQPHEASAEAGVSPDVTAAPGTATEAAGSATPEGAQPAQPDQKPEGKRDHWANERLGSYAARLRESQASHADKDRALADRDRQIADLLQRLQPQGQGQQQGQQQPQNRQPRAPTQADFDREVQRVAEQQAQAAEQQRAFQTWDAAGVEASATFHADCAVLAHAGALDNPAALPVLMDLDDSAAVVARLAADPAEAERIFALPPHRMAVALAKFAAKAPPATPVSRAPAPLSPVSGTANVDPDESKLSDDEWYRRQQGKRK